MHVTAAPEFIARPPPALDRTRSPTPKHMPVSGNPACASCAVRNACFAGRANAGEPTRVVLPIARRRIEAGAQLQRAPTSPVSVYVVRAGTMKTALPGPDGSEHVTGFHLPGDLIGLSAIARLPTPSVTTALEQGEICAIPYAELVRASGDARLLRQHFWSAISTEIVRSQHLARVLATPHAEGRVAAFLMDVSLRMKDLGYSSHEFHMRMTRREIGSYLGVRLETVSRARAAFVKQGLIQVSARHIRILDFEGLRSEACC